MNDLFLINTHSTYLNDPYVTDNIHIVSYMQLSVYYEYSISYLISLFVNVMIHNGGYTTLYASTILRETNDKSKLL